LQVMHIHQILSLMVHQDLALIHDWLRGVWMLTRGSAQSDFKAPLRAAIQIDFSMVTAMVAQGFIASAKEPEWPLENDELLLTAEGRRCGRRLQTKRPDSQGTETFQSLA
jgi:hypothetical protein